MYVEVTVLWWLGLVLCQTGQGSWGSANTANIAFSWVPERPKHKLWLSSWPFHVSIRSFHGVTLHIRCGFLLEHYLYDPEKFHPKRKQGLWGKKKKNKVGEPMWLCNQELRKLIIILSKIRAQMNVPESGYGFTARPSWAVPSLKLCSLLGEESPLRHSLLKEPTSIKMRSVVQGSHSSSTLYLSSSQHRTTHLLQCLYLHL